MQARNGRRLTVASGQRGTVEREMLGLTLPHPDAGLALGPGLRARLQGQILSEDTAHAPASDVFLGYPHGPRTSSFVPPGATVTTRTLALRGESLRLPVGDAVLWRTGAEVPVGSVFGPVRSLGANAVYYRQADVMVSAPQGAFRRVGKEIVLKLQGETTVEVRPDYVRNHLGYFLWDKRPVWSKPVSGWCSWMAYLQDVHEGEVLGAADFLAKNLRAYGYDIVQIDDGYQRSMQDGNTPFAPGERNADRWTQANAKFPSGLPALARGIRERGLTPGIWMGLYLPLGSAHASDYVMGTDGKPLRGPWVSWAMNGLEPGAEEAYADTIKTLKGQGWDYFKIDTLRHVLYDNYRVNPAYWTARGQSMESAYRRILTRIKAVVGASYVLACWGVIPELAGIPDGCRIGEDVGPDVESMRRSAKYIAQFHHLNDVVWRNDPDYMCLRLDPEKARSWASFVALAGGSLMISDKPSDYTPEHVRLMRQVGPPLVTKPLNAGPLPADPEFFLLNAAKFGEEWAVLSHQAWTATPAKSVPIARFGLSGPCLAFDFWRSEFLGVVDDTVSLRPLAAGACQVVGLRPVQNHPQVLGTDRHIGQGVHELDAVAWRRNSLSGRFRGGPDERWRLFIHVPKGYAVKIVSGAAAVQKGAVLTLTFDPSESPKPWSVAFGR